MIAYFDCFSGISGDMALGALIDLGVPPAWLKESIAALPLTGFDIQVAEVVYNGIRAKRVEVHAHGHHHHRHYTDIRSLIVDSPLPDPAKRTALYIFKPLAQAELAKLPGFVGAVAARHARDAFKKAAEALAEWRADGGALRNDWDQD